MARPAGWDLLGMHTHSSRCGLLICRLPCGLREAFACTRIEPLYGSPHGKLNRSIFASRSITCACLPVTNFIPQLDEARTLFRVPWPVRHTENSRVRCGHENTMVVEAKLCVCISRFDHWR